MRNEIGYTTHEDHDLQIGDIVADADGKTFDVVRVDSQRHVTLVQWPFWKHVYYAIRWPLFSAFEKIKSLWQRARSDSNA